MNQMGFTLDGLGNHNFDRGEQYLRETLIPLAEFRYVSSNVVDDRGRTPREWQPSRVFNVGGLRVGVVGFSNEDIPELTTPGSLGPFHVEPRVASVQAEIDRLQQTVPGLAGVVVMGHDGATAGTLTNPTGPIVDVANGLVGADVVIGDHTNFQVVSSRPNGSLVVENLSRGVRFTRVRVVIDTRVGDVVYTTADVHKPWK